MASYLELEELKRTWNGEVCIFGAGELGKYKGYDLLKAFGFHIDFYCDNYIPEGTVVKDEITVKDIQYLYENKDQILVFVCTSLRNQKDVLSQLEEQEIKHIVAVNSTYIANVLESIDKADNEVKKKYYGIYDDVEFLKKTFKRKMGYDLDIESPRTFNEKLQWLKLHDRNPEYTQMVDKYTAKEYVANKIGREYIIPTLGIYDTFDEIDFGKLPQQFVLKCTHDSGSVIICRNKDDFDIEDARNILENRLKKNYYWEGREWPYKNVRPRIIAEVMMEEESGGGIIDYKFYCFNGKPEYLYISAGLENHATAQITFYNIDLSEADFQRSDFKHFDQTPKFPRHYSQMIEIAKKLSKDITFVRVDLYEINGEVFFSEFTFTPCGGMMPFDREKYDKIIGRYINLNIKN